MDSCSYKLKKQSTIVFEKQLLAKFGLFNMYHLYTSHFFWKFLVGDKIMSQ